jgi:hypothetical protein
MKAVQPPNIFFQVIEDPSVKIVEPERAPIMAYLRHHYEPGNNTKLIRMQQRTKVYQVIGDEL